METRPATLVDVICRETGINDAMIADLVETFYGRVRQDPLLAPVFARVEDWDGHLVQAAGLLVVGRADVGPLPRPADAGSLSAIDRAGPLRPLAGAVRAGHL